MRIQIQKARNRFVGITVFTLVFSLIYEYFSHGVYSGFMVWAALIPLTGVVLPYTIWLKQTAGRAKRTAGGNQTAETEENAVEDETGSGSMAGSIYQSAVLTFLFGSFFSGILEIYGTTNRLGKVYWIVGGILLIVSLGMIWGRCLRRFRPIR